MIQRGGQVPGQLGLVVLSGDALAPGYTLVDGHGLDCLCTIVSCSVVPEEGAFRVEVDTECGHLVLDPTKTYTVIA